MFHPRAEYVVWSPPSKEHRAFVAHALARAVGAMSAEEYPLVGKNAGRENLSKLHCLCALYLGLAFTFCAAVDALFKLVSVSRRGLSTDLLAAKHADDPLQRATPKRLRGCSYQEQGECRKLADEVLGTEELPRMNSLQLDVRRCSVIVRLFCHRFARVFRLTMTVVSHIPSF